MINYATKSQKEKKIYFNVHAGESETWMSNVCKQIWKVYILGIRCGH